MIAKKSIIPFTFLGFFLSGTLSAQNVDSAKNEQRVRDYVAAFNEQDVDGMLEMVTSEVQWIYITGDKLAVEASGKPALRKSLTGYFKAAPKVTSKLEWIKVTTSRVAALERVSWTTKEGNRSQSSLSVYEFKDGKIHRVYYYPSER